MRFSFAGFIGGPTSCVKMGAFEEYPLRFLARGPQKKKKKKTQTPLR